MQDDPDGQETLAKFKRPRRSKKAAAKVALQDEVGNEKEVPIDKDKSLLNNKSVLESDGENLMDNIQAEPDGEEVGHLLTKSGSVVDGIQDTEDVEESILSLPKAKSIGDGMQEDPDGEETLAKFKRPRRSKKAVVKDALEDIGNEVVPTDKDKSSLKDKAVRETDDIPAKIKKPRRLKKREVKDALEVDVTKATETSIDTNQNLKVNIAEDSENTLTHFKKKKKTPKYAKDLPKVALASRHASASENDIKETANTDQVSKLQKTDGSSQGSPSALVEKTRASKGAKSGKRSLESNPDGAVKGYAVKASDIKKGKKQSDSQRAVRHVKKRRLGDMAYEGDSDWDVLMNGEEALESKSSVDKERPGRGRNRAGLILSMLGQVVPGEEAAVAAGLKVRQPGPVEKIKFKEVLKRRGGLQEYLECRNSILWLWGKDVRRILPLSDCGVSSTPLPDESPRDALIRDVYKFLDYHGYINVGVAVKKPKTKDDFEPKLKLSKESMQTENCGDKVADAEEEVAFILGQIKVSEENLSPGQNQIQVEGENQILLLNVEDVKRNKLAENCSGSTESDKKDSEECGLALMEIDEIPVVAPHTAENSTAEAAINPVVKTEVDIESAVARKDNEEIGTRDTSGSGGTEDEAFLGKDHGVKFEVDPLVKVHSALDQIKNSYGEDEFSDIDSAKVLHNLRKHDLQMDLQTDKQEAKLNAVSEANDANSVLESRKRIIVIGAGPAGLSAARHLQRLNCHVTVLEARDRVGGRVYTDHSALSVPVDLGASIITGVEADVATERRPDPSALLCTQLGLELTVLNSDCPLYDSVTGQKVPATLDEALEAEYNSLLDDMVMLVAQNGDVAMRMSLDEGLEYALKRRRIARSSSTGSELASSKTLLNDPDSRSTIRDSSVGPLEVLSATVDSGLKAVSENNVSIVAGMENGINMESEPDKLKLSDNSSMEQQSLSPLERRVMDWHFANLEYGCAAELSRVSLPYWNQDDAYGGFGGAHCMIKGGYSTVMEALAEGLNIQLGHVVTEISYSMKDSKSKGGIEGEVKVWTENKQEFVGDAVLITVPLGCLKANAIKFSPALPDWKLASIQQLGFGVLNKVIMEFPKVFWDESVDYFGATAESTDLRGRCFMFWNLKKTVGAPVLIALVVGKAAIDGKNLETSDHVKHAIMILRKLFGETAVPDPVASVATNWGGDPFSRGTYSYVAVGASGEDYDILGRPVENCLFFAGEATCKEHPDTVGGALMSGLREAVRIIDILENREDSMAEAEVMAAAQRHSDCERNEVRDMVKRLDAGELSSVLCKGSLDGEQKPLSKDALLQDMFGSAKTTAGRLCLAKKILQLPAAAVKSFAGTKEGLSILNKWILDSMGKDGTQLLRHCVRLLLIVSTDMLAVRQSGIGRTVKEKVCVHTSRDIRAVASQLVKMWIEVFRKEKANGGFKLKQLHGSAPNPGSSDAVKAKSKEQSSGKPSATVVNDVKGNTDQPPSTPINKNLALHSVQVEDGSELKKEANSVVAQTSDQGQPKKSEDCALSELEAAAIAAEEAARAAAAAAAEAYATSEAECSTFRELPKIPSFHKFARREQYVQKEDSDVRKRKWSGGVLGKQDCSSEIDSRSCRVRNWSVDFAATCGNLDSSRLAGSDFGSGNVLPPTDSNKKQRSQSNDVDSHSDLKERSAETGAVDSKSTKSRVQNSGSVTGVKIPDSRAKQPYSLGSHSEVFDQSIQKLNEKCSGKIEQLCIGKARHVNDDKGVAEAGSNRGSPSTKNGHKDETRGAEHIKKGITDYIASLLMPLYKTKKIDRDGYKSIMKKSTIKVMEHNTPAENAMTVSEFLDCKRRNKIRSLVDKFIEKHMASTQL
jgi:monoamine oxidase